MQVEWRNPKYCNENQTRMDIEVNHPVYGWIPFTLDPKDGAAQFDTAELFQEILDADASGEVAIADYDGPDPLDAWRARAALPWNEFLQACLTHGILTKAEIPVAAANQIPDSVQAKLSGLTPEEQADIAVTWALATVVHRNDPIIATLGPLYNLDDAGLDALFGYQEVPQ